PAQFDPVALEQYFRRQLDDRQATRKQIVVALYGLAGLDQPVLLSVHRLLQEPDLDVEEQLYLAHALARLGDARAARTVFRQVVATFGDRIGATMRLPTGRGRDEMLTATALAAALAARLGEPEAVPLSRYTAQNRPAERLTLLEELLALKATLERLSQQPARPVAFTYVLEVQETRKELSPGARFALALRL